MQQNIINFLKSKGLNVLDSDKETIESKMGTWKQWYKGKVDDFHKYKVYQGKQRIDVERKTLNMPLKVCQRWADLLLNEKVEIHVTDNYTQKKLEELLKQVNFKVRCNNLIERAFALGGGFLVQYYDNGTKQKYISQEYAYPITFENGDITECAFASKITLNNEEYNYVEIHTKNEVGEYVIDNFLLKNSKKKFIEAEQEVYSKNEIEVKVETHRTTPIFQQIRPNIANRDDFNSPWGTSVFSGSIDILKTIDTIYDGYCKEFLLGKKRIFVPDGVTNINYDSEGNPIEVFDPNDEVFYRLPNQEDQNSDPIIESNMELRVTQYDTGLQTQLNLLGMSVGFGNEGFTWDKGSVQTATQIISQNSEMFRTLKKHEELLKDVIINMVKGLLYMESEFGKDKLIKVDDEITVDFDDSIIEDTAEIKRQALLEFNAGLIDAIQYYQDVYKMTEEQATKFHNDLIKRTPIETEEPPEGDDDAKQ